MSSYYINTRSTDNIDCSSASRSEHIKHVTERQQTAQTQGAKTYSEQTAKQYKKIYKRRSSKVQQRVDWRRNKLSEYLIRGMSLPEISRVMNIPYKTLYDDQGFLTAQARQDMKNQISNLPFNIRQATDGLNKLVSMLYDIQDLDMMKARGRKTSDHVRVMAISLIKDCMKEKIEILTSQAAVNHALDFIEKTKQQVKQEFAEDMQQVISQDKIESAAINDAIEHNQEIQSYTPADDDISVDRLGNETATTTSEEAEELEEEQQEEEPTTEDDVIEEEDEADMIINTEEEVSDVASAPTNFVEESSSY